MATVRSTSVRPDAEFTSVVIPAYNEAGSIGTLIESLTAAANWYEVLVVDDGSTDGTADEAARAGSRVVRHPYNKGNGAAVKTGIRQASAPFVLILDADGQHQPADALRLVQRLGDYDLAVGARATATHASWSRRVGNAILNVFASYLAGRHIPDLTSGFRAARRDYLLEFLHLLPNGFSTPTTTTLAFLRAGYSVCFEPIHAAQREGLSKIRFGRDGFNFFLILLKVVTIYSPLRLFVPISTAAFLTGVGYAIWTIATQSHVTNSSVLLILLSVVIFLIGLVSEQISSLRFAGRPNDHER
jgi:glycosyltransferase involved in cell wall biosynthesis